MTLHICHSESIVLSSFGNNVTAGGSSGVGIDLNLNLRIGTQTINSMGEDLTNFTKLFGQVLPPMITMSPSTLARFINMQNFIKICNECILDIYAVPMASAALNVYCLDIEDYRKISGYRPRYSINCLDPSSTPESISEYLTEYGFTRNKDFAFELSSLHTNLEEVNAVATIKLGV